jgi:transcriptional regulator with XRE-family HTH domain
MTIQQLKALRERLGVSQARVARCADMTRFKLSLAECGHIDLRAEELNAIAKFLGQELAEVKAIDLPQAVNA